MRSIPIIKLLQFLFLFYFCIGYTKGATPSYFFQQLNLDKGLSQTTVNCILADNKGLIWIGTASGLSCFDRYGMKSYFHEKDNPYSLPGNTIYFIAEDSLNNIWVSTNNGLTLYDKSSDSFRPVKFEDKIIITNSFHTFSGSILFTADEGVYIYDGKSRTLHKRPVLQKDSSDFIPYYIRPWDKDEVLLISRRNGILRYNPVTDQITPTDYPIQTGDLNAVYLDSKKRLYLSSYNKGFVCYAPDGKKLYHIHTGNSKLNNNLVLDFLEINNKLWITTDGGGINIMDLENTSDITAIVHTPGDRNTLPVNSVKCIYKDKQDNIWVGTVRGGMIGIKEVFMKTYTDVPRNNTNGLSDISVISIHEDKRGRLWLGTDGGGINQYDPYTDTFKHYPSTYGDKVVSITDYSDSELLVSLYTKGMYLFNKETGNYHRPFYLIDEATTVDQFHGGNASLAYRVTNEWAYFLGKNAVSHSFRTGKFSFLKIDGKKLAVGPMKMVCADDKSAFIIQSNNLYEVYHGSDTPPFPPRIGGE